jgi:hypothetical protein
MKIAIFSDVRLRSMADIFDISVQSTASNFRVSKKKVKLSL